MNQDEHTLFSLRIDLLGGFGDVGLEGVVVVVVVVYVEVGCNVLDRFEDRFDDSCICWLEGLEDAGRGV